MQGTHSEYTLEAQRRTEVGKRKLKRVRSEHRIPGVIYGTGIDAIPITVDEGAFIRLYHQVGDSTIIELSLDGKRIPALVYDIQRDSVKRRILHIDFLKVDMKKKLQTEVHLTFTGEAPAVKEKGAVLVHHIDMVEVECLPQNLPSHIEVDQSSLRDVWDVIRVGDIRVPEGVSLLTDPDTVVVVAEQPGAAEQEPEKEAEEGEKAEGEAQQKEEGQAEEKAEGEPSLS